MFWSLHQLQQTTTNHTHRIAVYKSMNYVALKKKIEFSHLSIYLSIYLSIHHLQYMGHVLSQKGWESLLKYLFRFVANMCSGCVITVVLLIPVYNIYNSLSVSPLQLSVFLSANRSLFLSLSLALPQVLSALWSVYRWLTVQTPSPPPHVLTRAQRANY